MTTATQLTEEATSRYAQAGGHRVHYNEAGTGSVVIMLHGSGPGASSWSNFAPRNLAPLSAKHRVLLVDQLSYGKTDSVVLTEPGERARSVRDLMDALNIEKASLMGNSMGGGTALNFTVEYPERVEKLILMGSGGGGGSSLFGHTPSEGIRVVNETHENPTPENFRRMFDVMLYDASSIGDDVLKARSEAAQANPAHQEARRKSSAPFRDLGPSLPNITAPTLILHGRDDRVVPMEGSVRLVGIIPNSRLVVFNHCGHWIQYEHADEFNRLVLDFLAH